MASQEWSWKGRPSASSSRSNITPPGYKNVRVFVPKSLHFRLVSHSAASEMTLQEFVVAVLERAAPLTPAPSSPGPALGHRPSQDGQEHLKSPDGVRD